jgi:hypothetical protein
MNPMTEFIFGILSVLLIVVYAIVTTYIFFKDAKSDNYEYKQPKNKEELW